jgi:threonine/homoserine/homoserine lactone efflux protein
MNLELIFTFITFAFVSTITPGPNNMMILASGLNYGIRRSLPHLFGIVIGFGCMVFLAGMGLFTLLDHLPILYNILHIVSVIYLVYLAWKIATAKPLGNTQNAHSKPMTFLQAAAFQWVNPKAIVIAMAAITTYVPETPESDFVMNVMIVSILFALVTLPCTGIWAVFGSSFRRFLNNPLYYRIFNVTMAILLLLSLYPLLYEIKMLYPTP